MSEAGLGVVLGPLLDRPGHCEDRELGRALQRPGLGLFYQRREVFFFHAEGVGAVRPSGNELADDVDLPAVAGASPVVRGRGLQADLRDGAFAGFGGQSKARARGLKHKAGGGETIVESTAVFTARQLPCDLANDAVAAGRCAVQAEVVQPIDGQPDGAEGVELAVGGEVGRTQYLDDL